MGSGAKAAAGCGAFGLVGLLAAIGVVVAMFFVTRNALTAGHGDDERITTTLAVQDLPEMTATADPASGLGERPDVVITSGGWAIGTELTLRTCLTGAELVLGTEDPCDEVSAVTYTSDDRGEIEVSYPVDRVVTAGGLPHDCASTSTTCAVVVAGADRDGRDRTASATISFAEGLPAPDLLEELGG